MEDLADFRFSGTPQLTRSLLLAHSAPAYLPRLSQTLPDSNTFRPMLVESRKTLMRASSARSEDTLADSPRSCQILSDSPRFSRTLPDSQVLPDSPRLAQALPHSQVLPEAPRLSQILPDSARPAQTLLTLPSPPRLSRTLPNIARLCQTQTRFPFMLLQVSRSSPKL